MPPAAADRLLRVDDVDAVAGSRVAGCAPDCFDEAFLADRWYLVTLSPADVDCLDGRECSVFVPRGSELWSADQDYPDIAVEAVLHAPSTRGSSDAGVLPGRPGRALVPTEERGDAFVVCGGTSDLAAVQPLDAYPVVRDGHRFVAQLDDDGWPDGDADAPRPLSQGAVYLFGDFDGDRLRRVLPGVVQF